MAPLSKGNEFLSYNTYLCARIHFIRIITFMLFVCEKPRNFFFLQKKDLLCIKLKKIELISKMRKKKLWKHGSLS
jgi:hypothetical protein